MSSQYAQCSREVKPQSIAHHIGRLGSKIAKPIKRRRRIRMLRKKLQEGSVRPSKQPVTVLESDTSSILLSEAVSIACSITYSNASAPVSDDTSSQVDNDTIDTDDVFSFFTDSDEDSEGEEEEGIFETVNQNELLLECFLTNEQSDMLFLVHFFNQENSIISGAVEDTVSMRVQETKSKCECLRINSKSAPLFASKLQIDPEQPTVVAIKNGKVLSKVSGVSSSECIEVDQWLTRTRLLENNASVHTFSGLSTKL